MTDPTRKTLFQLSFPLFLHSMVTLAVMVLDTMIFSAHSAAAATSLSIAGPILRVAFELSTMIGLGGVILISNRLGAGDHQGAALAAEVAILANSVLGLLISIGLAVLGPWVVSFMSMPADIAKDAVLYLYLAGSAMLFHGFGNAAVSCLRGYGASRTVLVLGVFGAVLFLTLEYVLILGAGPIPALGVLGSGLSNVIMRTVVALVLAIVVVRQLRLSLRVRVMLAEWGMIRRIVNLSFPSVSDYIAYGFYQIILLGLISSFGSVAVLSRAYVMIAMTFLTLVIMALSQGNEVMIGYQRGARDLARAYAQAWRSTFWATGLATGLAVGLWLGADPFVGLFTDDPEVKELSQRLLLLTILLQPGFAFNMILFHALRAIGDVRWPVVVGQGLTWGMSLPLAWFLCSPMGYGVEGIWYAMIAEECAKAVVMSWRWVRKMHPSARAAPPVEPAM
ncbi:MAG: MATE family efflux transporter [Epibacterium sp.]|nr:MATE family efflux transporter [Epibacterium sp.]NQX75257.1 MATE family efflux transporter [Epibacterium sp.]